MSKANVKPIWTAAATVAVLLTAFATLPGCEKASSAGSTARKPMSSGSYNSTYRSRHASSSCRSPRSSGNRSKTKHDFERASRDLRYRIVWGTDKPREIAKRKARWAEQQRQWHRNWNDINKNIQRGFRDVQQRSTEQNRRNQRQINDFSRNLQKMFGGNR